MYMIIKMKMITSMIIPKRLLSSLLMTALVWLIFINIQHIPLVDSLAINTVYLSFISSKLKPTCNTLSASGSTRYASLTMKGDDTPYHHVHMPFEFHFFGRLYEDVWITPNGALQLDGHLPFDGLGFSYGNAGSPFKDNYYNLIAGLLVDLNPSLSSYPGSNITYFIPNSEDFMQVCFTDINFFGYKIKNSFDITIYDDSSVAIQWLDINIKSPLYNTIYKYNISGLRYPNKEGRSQFTASQKLIGKSVWDTPVLGIYPEYQYYSNGYRFVSCPISTIVCSKPREIVIPFTSPTNFITITAVSLSCQSEIHFAITLDSSKTINPLVTTTKSLSDPSLYSCNISISDSNSIECNITSFLQTNPTSNNNEYFIKLYWTTADKTDSPSYEYESVPIADLSVFLRSTSASYNSFENCAVNLYGNTSCFSSNPCSVCNANFTCLDLPCDDGANLKPYKYRVAECPLKTCTSDSPYLTYKSTDVALYGCCTVPDLDCNGNCRGPAVIAHTMNYSTMMCAVDPKKVDCTGTYIDSSNPKPILFDACGVCGGADKTGATCNNGIIFNTLFPGGKDFYPVISLNDTFGTISMNITNKNDTSLAIVIDVVGTLVNAPSIFNFPKSINVPGNSSTVVSFQISFSQITKLSVGAKYENKVLRFKYTRPALKDIPAAFFTSVVYVLATGCDTLPKENYLSRCNALPGCIYCSEYPAQRVLKAAEEEKEDKTAGGGGERDRGLLISIVPIEESILFPSNYPGICIDGTSTLACPVFESSASSVSFMSISRLKAENWGLFSHYIVVTFSTVIPILLLLGFEFL